MTQQFNILYVANPTATVTKGDNGRYQITIVFSNGSKIYMNRRSLEEVREELAEWGVDQTDPLSYLY